MIIFYIYIEKSKSITQNLSNSNKKPLFSFDIILKILRIIYTEKELKKMKSLAQANIVLFEIGAVLVGLYLLFVQQNSSADFQYETHMHQNVAFRFNSFFQLFCAVFEITKNII